jgi:REP element-mobilizing transposase RayT
LSLPFLERQGGNTITRMTVKPKRFQHQRCLHFITFSCYQRRKLLDSAAARETFEDELERVRRWYGCYVGGYVVMPEHVHLLISEPQRAELSVVLQMLKQITSRQLRPADVPRFWQVRYYDFAVWSEQKRVVFLDNGPICESDYRSAQLARERHAKAKSAPPQEQQWLLSQGFGALRTSYEHFIIFELLNGVVERFEERISFGRLADVSLDKQMVDEVVERMEAISGHIDAHLHSDSFAAQKPGPAELLSEIEAFEALRKRHKEAKKAAQQPAAVRKPATPTQPASSLESQGREASKVTPEGVDLEKRSRLMNQLRTRN